MSTAPLVITHHAGDLCPSDMFTIERDGVIADDIHPTFACDVEVTGKGYYRIRFDGRDGRPPVNLNIPDGATQLRIDGRNVVVYNVATGTLTPAALEFSART